MSIRSGRHSQDLSYGLTSEPMVVSTSTSASRVRVKKNNIQVGGGYKIILAPDDARLFIENVRTLQKTEGKKQSIKIDNAVDYGNAAKHIDSALTILVNDISPEKKKLETLKQKFEKLAESTEFYVFETHIKCKVMIDGKEIDGELIAMDDGVVAVAKTARGNFMVTLESQLEIEKHGGYKKSNTTTSSQKSIFTSSSGSSQRSSTKLESPATESSLSSTPVTASNTDTSPYLATSEYDLTESEIMNNNAKKGQTSEVQTTSDSSAKTSSTRSSDKTTSTGSSDKTSSTSSSDKTSSVRSSVSDQTESENAKKSGMRGGRRDTKKIYKDMHNKSKFMKAGKSDSVGIIESVKGYYSESTSIEDGLCE